MAEQATAQAAPQVVAPAIETPAAPEPEAPKLNRRERKTARREAAKSPEIITRLRAVRASKGDAMGDAPIEGRSDEGEPGDPVVPTTEETAPTDPAPPLEPESEKPGEKKLTLEERELKAAREFSALRRERQQAKERRVALEAREKAIAEREKTDADFDKLKRENPYEAAKRLGLSVADLAKRALEPTETPEQIEMRTVREELAALKAEREAEKAERDETRKREAEQSEQRAHVEGTANIASVITQHSDSVPFVVAWGKEQVAADIWAFMLNHYKETANPATGKGEVLDSRKLLLQYEGELKKRFPTPQGQGGTPARAGASQGAKPETQEASRLTNQDAGTRASPSPPPMTDREQRAAAAKKIRRA